MVQKSADDKIKEIEKAIEILKNADYDNVAIFILEKKLFAIKAILDLPNKSKEKDNLK